MWDSNRAWNSDLEDLGSCSFSGIGWNKTLLVALIKQPELTEGKVVSVWLSQHKGYSWGPREENRSRAWCQQAFSGRLLRVCLLHSLPMQTRFLCSTVHKTDYSCPSLCSNILSNQSNWLSSVSVWVPGIENLISSALTLGPHFVQLAVAMGAIKAIQSWLPHDC